MTDSYQNSGPGDLSDGSSSSSLAPLELIGTTTATTSGNDSSVNIRRRAARLTVVPVTLLLFAVVVILSLTSWRSLLANSDMNNNGSNNNQLRGATDSLAMYITSTGGDNNLSTSTIGSSLNHDHDHQHDHDHNHQHQHQQQHQQPQPDYDGEGSYHSEKKCAHKRNGKCDYENEQQKRVDEDYYWNEFGLKIRAYWTTVGERIGAQDTACFQGRCVHHPTEQHNNGNDDNDDEEESDQR